MNAARLRPDRASAPGFVACACDDSPKQVNDSIAALTSLPRLPSDLADELRRLKAIIDQHSDSDRAHIHCARHVRRQLHRRAAHRAAANRSDRKLTELFEGASDGLPGRQDAQ